MKTSFALRGLRMAALAAATGLAACTASLLPPTVTPVVAPSTSVPDANKRLADVAAERTRVEAEFAASEQICYEKFFVNNCLDKAKEKRRNALVGLRAVEVEAEYYRRKVAVEQRDREVAEAVKEFEISEARMAAEQEKEQAPAKAPRAASPRGAGLPKPSLTARGAEQAAKLARHAEEEKAEAPKRAAKAREFEQRRLKAEKRQRDIAAKKAAKNAEAPSPAN